MKNKKYILFDLDGTLTDSKEGIFRCFRHAFEALGVDQPDEDTMKSFLGPPLTASFRTASFRRVIGDEERAAEGVRIYRERYSTVGLFENKPYEGIAQLLDSLKKKGYILAVATSKPEPFSKRILERFGLIGFFETVTGCGLDGSLDTKSEVIKETLRRLGVEDKSEAVMVGDRKYDILGAREAGLECIGAGWGFGERSELEEYGACVIVPTVAGLGELFDQQHRP